VKIAAYQAPLLPPGSPAGLDLIRRQVRSCEEQGVAVLCCPEGILGGLADYAADPGAFAIATQGDGLRTVLAPLASETVTTIVGFTEVTATGRLYNAAAVYHQGSVIGVYRKLYPAINRSVYDPGDQMPVFRIGDLTFGIVICNDSNYLEPARIMAARGATALFVPTNTGLPPAKACADLIAHSRNCDIARAIENSLWVIRADVVGDAAGLTAAGASGIVDPGGMVRATADRGVEDLLVTDVPTSPPERRRGWDAARNRAVMGEYARLVSRTWRTDAHTGRPHNAPRSTE
jgi:predicted amidohydrolase